MIFFSTADFEATIGMVRFHVIRCWLHRCLFGETCSWYGLAVSKIGLLYHANGLDCVPMVDHPKANAELFKFSFYLSLANKRSLIEESDCAHSVFRLIGFGKRINLWHCTTMKKSDVVHFGVSTYTTTWYLFLHLSIQPVLFSVLTF